LIILDTHALIYDALTPARLSARARKAIALAFAERELACSDISLWEVAMLVERGRLSFSVPLREWLDAAAHPRSVRVPRTLPSARAISQRASPFARGSRTSVRGRCPRAPTTSLP
jgi:PIN domain nuclease of toxin-antitoxin system